MLQQTVFLHSEQLVLVDWEGRIRSRKDDDGNVVGSYNTRYETEMRDLSADIKVLIAEFEKEKARRDYLKSKAGEMKPERNDIRVFSSGIGLLLLLVLPFLSQAQCSMCRAVAESSQQGGSSIAAGLNDGILYLMAIPYVLLATLGVLFYRHRKKLRTSA